MKALFFALSLTLFASATQARSIMPNSATITFTGLGTGIDQKALEEVRYELAHELRAGHISHYVEQSFGLEGERRLCVVIAKEGDYHHIFDVVRHLRVALDRRTNVQLRLGLGCQQ